MLCYKNLIGICILGFAVSVCANEVSTGKDASAIGQMIEKELQSGLTALGSKQGLALLAEAPTGKIIARVRIGDNFKYFAPASMLKPLVIAAALDSGTVTPETEIDCEKGVFMINKRPLRDVVPYRELPVSEILTRNSNIGTAKIAIRMGADKLIPYLKKLHIPYPKDLHDELILSQFAIGYSYVKISPEQLLEAWCKLAADDQDDFKSKATVPAINRMLAARTGAANGLPVQTGTYSAPDSSDYIGSCIGSSSAEQPKYVLLVSIQGAPGMTLYGKRVIPVWKNIMDKL